jgi:sodium-dependent dicarboxylate transporter 2/3/5
MPRYRLAGLIGGPLAALALLWNAPPGGLSSEAWCVAAVGLWMVLWWMTEAVPLAVTALLPLLLFPTLGVKRFEAAAAAYADPVIFLFLGGFLLAAAMQRWQLSRRLALCLLRQAGSSPAAIIAAMMAATGFLSLWMSNTATTMVMLPIAQSVIDGFRRDGGNGSDQAFSRFTAALMLGVAYAASIGGMGSLIGTPPNALLAGFMRESYGLDISFGRWMLVGLPAVAVLLPATWFVLTHVVFRFSLPQQTDQAGMIAAKLRSMGPMSRGEWIVGAVFMLTATGWIIGPLLRRTFPWFPQSDAGIAVAAAILLFAIPGGATAEGPLLRWEDTRRLPWGVLILFGGGLALAEAITQSGLALWIGQSVNALGDWPRFVLVLIICALVVLLGELASNTAIAAMLLPIASVAAIAMGEDPLTLAVPVALAASIGFMLPVATPPNAIVFSSGLVTSRQMLRAGILLDILGIVLVTLIAVALGPLVRTVS